MNVIANIQTSKLRLKVLFNMLPIIGLMLIYTTPLLQASLSQLIPLGVTLVWLFHTLILTGKISFILNQKAKWWILYYLLGFVMILIGLSNVAFNFQIVSLPKYIIPVMGYFIIKYYNIKEIKVLVFFFVLAFYGNLVWNIIINFLQPELFESLSSSEESRELSTMMNLANTSHNALCLFGVGALWMCIENTKGFIKKFFLIALLGVLAYFMLMVSTRGTTTLLLGLLIIGIYLARKEPASSLVNRKRYYRFWIITLSILALFVITPLLLFIVEHIDSDRLVERLNDVLTLTSGGNLNDLPEGSLALRIELSRVSLNTFFSNPINMLIGVGEQSYYIGDDLSKVKIGMHSEFFDVLARNGIIGAFIYFKILKIYISTLHSLSNNRNITKFVDVLFFVFIVYGFLNNVFQPFILLFVFIIYPSLIILLNTQENGK